MTRKAQTQSTEPKTLPMNDENKRRVLEALKLRIEYANMGVDLIGEPDDKGWIKCRSMHRKDSTPSAGVNVNPNHEHFGYYHDFGATDRQDHFSFWDACVERNLASSAPEAFQRFARQVGLISAALLPPKKHGINPKINRLAINEQPEDIGFIKYRPPCTLDGFLLTGGMKVNVNDGSGLLGVLPVYDQYVDDENLIGGATFNWWEKDLNGQKI